MKKIRRCFPSFFSTRILEFSCSIALLLSTHTLKSKSTSEKFLCNAGDRYWVVATMTLEKTLHTSLSKQQTMKDGHKDKSSESRYQESFLVDFFSVSGLFVEVVWIGDKVTGDDRQTYWLVSSLITLQSRGKMVSFIRFRNTQKIFNRNSWWRISHTHFIKFSFQSHVTHTWKHA